MKLFIDHWCTWFSKPYWSSDYEIIDNNNDKDYANIRRWYVRRKKDGHYLSIVCIKNEVGGYWVYESVELKSYKGPFLEETRQYHEDLEIMMYHAREWGLGRVK